MSVFNELLPKINEISNTYTLNINKQLQEAFALIDKFEEDYKNGVRNTMDNIQREKHVLPTMQSIPEDEDATTKQIKESRNQTNQQISTEISKPVESDLEQMRATKKRNKKEVDGLNSPAQDKRPRRSASVKAKTNIAKQVNVNLNQKLRRDDSDDKKSKSSRTLKQKDEEEDKENCIPVEIINIKQEKISLPNEELKSEETEEYIVSVEEMKQEVTSDMLAMPPPTAPVPKPRKAITKDQSTEDKTDEEDDSTIKKRTSRRKKKESVASIQQPELLILSRPTRSSSRASKKVETAQEIIPTDVRPKRTRAKKKVTEAVSDEVGNEIKLSADSGICSPADKPRAKRTRRAPKTETKPHQETPPEKVAIPIASDNTEQIEMSPILIPKKTITKKNVPEAKIPEKIEEIKQNNKVENTGDIEIKENEELASKEEVNTKILVEEMDKTMVLTNGNHHEPMRNMNETIVLGKFEGDNMLDIVPKIIMDSTVIINKDPNHVADITDDTSIMTDDSDHITPPRQNVPKPQPVSAVKEKVQQFEELASRQIRTKTRAMAKKEEQTQSENHTPPDKIIKQTLPMETLQKMNSMIFNGKQPVVSGSANKIRVNTVGTMKSNLPLSTSKLSGINRTREAVVTAEETMKREKEDARKKKEAILEAKKEQQRRKREDKMAAAAAAREAANKERQAALNAAVKERMDRQAHADQGKIERLKEIERKKQELARKVAETEERRKAEEQARQQRLAEDQRADAIRKKRLEEAEMSKKEDVKTAKEFEMRQKEYMEKQKMKQRAKDKMHTPRKMVALDPVYMEDGFQYLNSDEEGESEAHMPIPEWSTSKRRHMQLCVQSLVCRTHIDRLFSVRTHSPDLQEIFPNIDRARLKRTSSAVWRTPPSLSTAANRPLPTTQE